MKRFNHLKLAAFTLFILLSIGAAAKIKKTTLKRGIFGKQLTMEATGLGGATKTCLKLAITNITQDTLTVTIDPALIFKAEDTSYQDLVTWGDEVLVIEPAVKKEIDLVAFCGKSYAACPRPKLNYKYSKQGDTNMIKTLRYARKNNMNPHVVQGAVWMYTNNHPLNTVYSYRHAEQSEQLVSYLATQKKLPMPKQYMELTRNERAGQPVISAEGLRKIYIPVKWKNMPDVRHMYVTILKENGDVYKRILGNEEITGDQHTVWVEFNSVNDTKGIYYLELKDNNNKVWDKHKVVIGYGITEER